MEKLPEDDRESDRCVLHILYQNEDNFTFLSLINLTKSYLELMTGHQRRLESECNRSI